MGDEQPRWPRGAPDDEHGHGQGGRWVGRLLTSLGVGSTPHVPGPAAPVEPDRSWLDRLDLPQVMDAVHDKSRGFGDQMAAVHRFNQVWEAAAQGDDAIAAVPYNEDFWGDTDLDPDYYGSPLMDQEDALKWYGFYGYQTINALLRAGRGDIDAADPDTALVPELRGSESAAEAKKNADLLLEAMSHSRTTEDIVVWRGVGSISAMLGRPVDDDSFSDVMRDLEWVDHGFTSTATDGATIREFLDEAHLPTLAEHQGEADPVPVILKILVPAGTRALSRGERDGTEILLPPGMRYRVWKTYTDTGRRGGTWVAELVALDGWEGRGTSGG